MSDNKYGNDYYFECGCFHPEHRLSFCFFKDDEFPEMYVDIHLTNYPFVKRFWLGMSYILGIRPKQSHFESWTLGWSDINKLQNMLNEFKEAVYKFHEKANE